MLSMFFRWIMIKIMRFHRHLFVLKLNCSPLDDRTYVEASTNLVTCKMVNFARNSLIMVLAIDQQIVATNTGRGQRRVGELQGGTGLNQIGEVLKMTTFCCWMRFGCSKNENNHSEKINSVHDL
uniref:(northern house mosquito) hypothetical protein n=1 Tax=Culex pipiens TaxID=7175 RepID=A0A8D8IIF1_CULPI